MNGTQDDAPFGIFKTLYTLATWGGTVLLAGITIWLFWHFFTHTAPGTANSQRLAEVRPTVTAVVSIIRGTVPAGEPTPEGGVKVQAVVNAVELPGTCYGCHKIEGNAKAVGVTCPDLTHIATKAAERIKAADYTGTAKTAAEYIRESIMDPNAYVVPDLATYKSADGKSVMPPDVAKTTNLSGPALDDVVNYLASLK